MSKAYTALLITVSIALFVALIILCCGLFSEAEAAEIGEDANTHTYSCGPVGPEGAAVVDADGLNTEPTQNLRSEEELRTELRVRKLERIVRQLYPNSGFLPYCRVLVETHERMERDGGPRAVGFGAAWWESATYGGANFSLQVGGVAPGNCRGPMDVKTFPPISEPIANIEYHCREMLGFYKRGVRGRDLCEFVFFPARPRDWGGGRFRRTEAKHRAIIQRGYSVGKLP